MDRIFNDLSDELLAQYIDGNTSEDENRTIEDSIHSISDLQTICLAESASKISEDLDELPSFGECGDINIHRYDDLMACGFLGNDPEDDDGKNEKE